MSTSQTLSGVYPIADTPFHPDGSVDFDSQDRLIDYLLEQGAHGLGLFGNASEGYTLSAPERTELMRRIAKRVNGRVPLVASSDIRAPAPPWNSARRCRI